MEASGKECWVLADKRKMYGLDNKMKSSRINNGDLCLLFYSTYHSFKGIQEWWNLPKIKKSSKLWKYSSWASGQCKSETASIESGDKI